MDWFTNAIYYKLFPLGQTYVTPMGIAYFLIGMVLLIWATGRLKNLLVARLLSRTPLQPGARQAIATIARYLLLFVGFVVILQAAGIDLTAFNVLAGAIGIGIGLGLQNVANNFISGLILLIERPVQVGDFVDVDKITGTVESIGPRSTRIRTNDNITIIVPNKKLIDENVVNWSYRSDTIRFRIPAQLVHDTDIDLATRLMCEAASENPDVAEDPKPAVRLMKVDATGLHFELRAWSKKRLNRPGLFTSDINFAMMRKFRENGIQLYNASSSVMNVHMLDRVQVEEESPADGGTAM